MQRCKIIHFFWMTKIMYKEKNPYGAWTECPVNEDPEPASMLDLSIFRLEINVLFLGSAHNMLRSKLHMFFFLFLLA